jgi:hypothetical protein
MPFKLADKDDAEAFIGKEHLDALAEREKGRQDKWDFERRVIAKSFTTRLFGQNPDRDISDEFDNDGNPHETLEWSNIVNAAVGPWVAKNAIYCQWTLLAPDDLSVVTTARSLAALLMEHLPMKSEK